MPSKNEAFYQCLAGYLSEGDEELAKWYDKILAHPTNAALIDSASDADGDLGPARMAYQVREYAAGEIDMPEWMKAF